jgi:hypothetical protein
MRKILLGLLTAGAIGGVAMFATGAFFSDTETSTGNTLQAGSIDLGVDNHSYYNGVLNPETTWRVDYDLSDDPQRQFFNFTDLKPGDWGEDTISLHVKDNDSWLCADVKLTSDNDNGLTEPEGDDGDITPGIGEGELADAVNFFWWADDGDNVFESDETLLPAGPLGALSVDQTATVALADSQVNIWGDDGPLPGDSVRWVAKAWCFGATSMTPYPQDGGNLGSGPDARPVVCDGSLVNNVTQSDSLTADISFRAIQSRHNESFVCDPNGGGDLCNEKIDLMLVMDNSGSIDDGEETLMQAGAVSFITAMDITDPLSHAGLVSFSNNASLDQALTGVEASVIAAINDPFNGGFTNLSAGILTASTELAGANDRPDGTIPDVMVIITDGNPNLPDNVPTAEAAALAAANAARAAGTTVYVVGVGGDVDATYLQTIADPGKYFPAANFAALEQALLDIVNCQQNAD